MLFTELCIKLMKRKIRMKIKKNLRLTGEIEQKKVHIAYPFGKQKTNSSPQQGERLGEGLFFHELDSSVHGLAFGCIVACDRDGGAEALRRQPGSIDPHYDKLCFHSVSALLGERHVFGGRARCYRCGHRFPY